MFYRLIAGAAVFLAVSYAMFAVSTHEHLAPARSWTAEQMIEISWQRSQQTGKAVAPWPGVDSHPVVRLAVPALERDMVVMRGVKPAILAHAPGWNEGTEPPGMPGISMISGYHDGAFSFLRHLEKGMALRLEQPDGQVRHYVVDELAIVQSPEIRLNLSHDESVILLLTSYPLENWESGRQIHFVVSAREQAPRLFM